MRRTAQASSKLMPRKVRLITSIWVGRGPMAPMAARQRCASQQPAQAVSSGIERQWNRMNNRSPAWVRGPPIMWIIVYTTVYIL